METLVQHALDLLHVWQHLEWSEMWEPVEAHMESEFPNATNEQIQAAMGRAWKRIGVAI